MDYAHYQAQLAHAASLPSLVQSGSPSAQTLAAAAVAGHNLTGSNQGGHSSLSQAVISAAHLATVSYESMLAASTSPALYTAGMHMNTGTGHHMGISTPVHHHHSGRQKKKPKINKDGVPAPKRATTAYINFTQWYREEIKKQGRTVPRIGDFGKECAGKWNNMPEDDKAPFVASANKDRERYRKQMAIYKPVRDVNKPKRPGTAFMLFMGDFRKEMAGREPEGGVAALAKLGGERWRSMTDEDKRPYVEKQATEKIKYEEAMEEYRRKQSVEGSLAKQARMGGVEGEDDENSLSREGVAVGLARPPSADSNSPHTPTTPSGPDNVTQSQLQQQIQQMVAASQSQSQQLANIAPPPAHTSSASALDFSIQHATANLQNFQAHAQGSTLQSHIANAAPNTAAAVNYSQALPQQANQQQQQQAVSQDQPESPDENASNFNNGQTTAAAPNYNQAHMAGHYGWV